MLSFLASLVAAVLFFAMAAKRLFAFAPQFFRCPPLLQSFCFVGTTPPKFAARILTPPRKRRGVLNCVVAGNDSFAAGGDSSVAGNDSFAAAGNDSFAAGGNDSFAAGGDSLVAENSFAWRWFAKFFVAVVLAAAVLSGGGVAVAHGDDDGDGVVLINVFSVAAGKTEEAVAMWEKARDVMREQEGYISTRLHLSLSADARYRLINVAEWETVAHFRAAQKELRESGVLRRIDGVRAVPNLYSVIREDD